MKLSNDFNELMIRLKSDLLYYDDSSVGKLLCSIKSIPDKIIDWTILTSKINKQKMLKEKMLEEKISELVTEYQKKAKSATAVNNFAKYSINNDEEVKRLKKEIIDLTVLEKTLNKILKMAEKKMDIYMFLIKIDKNVIVNKYTDLKNENLEEMLTRGDVKWG